MSLQDNLKIQNAYIGMYSRQRVVESASVEHALHDDSHPALYIGTYGNYNDGSLDGEGLASGWVDLTTFDSADEFRKWLSEQSGGKDVEWMFQDFMNFPRDLYSESGINDKIWDYIEFKNDVSSSGLTEEQVDAVVDEIGWESAKRAIDDDRIYVYGGCSSLGDVAQYLVDEHGADVAFRPEDYENAFDYDAFGRDLMMDWHTGDPNYKDAEGNPQQEDHYYDQDDNDLGEYESDRQVGEDYVMSLGNISELGDETVMRYVDFDRLGSDLRYDGQWIKCGDDMINVAD